MATPQFETSVDSDRIDVHAFIALGVNWLPANTTKQ